MSERSSREMKMQQLLEFCSEPRSSAEMMEHLGLTNKRSFRASYLSPLQEAGLIRMIRPDLPTWCHQKYVTVDHDA